MTARNTHDAGQILPFYFSLDDRQRLRLEAEMVLGKTFGIFTSWEVTSVAIDGDRALVTYNCDTRRTAPQQVALDTSSTGVTSEWQRFDGEWYRTP